jgi:ribosome-binding factor A
MATKKRENHRVDRVSARVQEELSLTLLRDFTDPRLAGVVLSHVAMTDDLSYATVSFVVMGDGPDLARAKEAVKVLRKLSPALRAKLAGKLDIRRAPEVIFEVDAGREAVERLDKLLHEVETDLKRSESDKKG